MGPPRWGGCDDGRVAPVAAPPPFLPPPPLAAWLQHTAVARIHLCHRPTAGLMSSPVKPLKHSTWAGPTPGPAAQGLPPRVPRLPLNLHKVSGRPDPTGAGPTGARPDRGLSVPPPPRPRASAPRPGLGGAGGLLLGRTEPSRVLLGLSLPRASGAGPFPLAPRPRLVRRFPPGVSSSTGWELVPGSWGLRRGRTGALGRSVHRLFRPAPAATSFRDLVLLRSP